MSDTRLPVVILAGGLGKRLWPITQCMPKVLVSVCGEPFLSHQLRLLRDRGIERLVLSVGYLGEMVEEYAGDGSRFGMHIDYSRDWPELRGTAGAVQEALPLLPDRFFVLYGDSYLPCDYLAVQRAFAAAGRRALMTVYRNEGQWDASNVEYWDGHLLAYNKKNRTRSMQHIDYGLGVFERGVFEGLTPGKHDLADVYRDLLGDGELAAFETAERFYEIGSMDGIRDLEEYLRRKEAPA